jgi:hypothetical protein
MKRDVTETEPIAIINRGFDKAAEDVSSKRAEQIINDVRDHVEADAALEQLTGEELLAFLEALRADGGARI